MNIWPGRLEPAGKEIDWSVGESGIWERDKLWVHVEVHVDIRKWDVFICGLDSDDGFSWLAFVESCHPQ